MEILKILKKSNNLNYCEIFFGYEKNEDGNIIHKSISNEKIYNIIQKLKIFKLKSNKVCTEYYYNYLIKSEIEIINEIKINYITRNIKHHYIDNILIIIKTIVDIEKEKFPEIKEYDYYTKKTISEYESDNFDIIIYNNEFNDTQLSLKIKDINYEKELISFINKINELLQI